MVEGRLLVFESSSSNSLRNSGAEGTLLWTCEFPERVQVSSPAPAQSTNIGSERRVGMLSFKAAKLQLARPMQQHRALASVDPREVIVGAQTSRSFFKLPSLLNP